MAETASQLTGKVPPRRLTADELVKTHRSHLKKQDLNPHAPRPVKQPQLDQAYPASTRSIRDLEIIPLTSLRVEHHHRGQGLIVRVISPPFVGAGVVSLVEDGEGNADKLAIYNHSDSSILSGVPEGCVVAVKEPYYKYNGAGDDYMVCVDHPSDVVLLRFTDPIIPEKLRLGPLLRSAEEWRQAGDKAFLERDFPTGVFCYSEALEAAAGEEEGEGPAAEKLRADVYAKRAGTNLMLGQYDAAKSDALASRTGGAGGADWRAYFTAGRAAYGLCDYTACKGYLDSALELNPSAAAVRKEHSRCLARLQEEEKGEYDFPALFKSLSPNKVHLDIASFLGNTRVDASSLHGRGLFATRDIAAGELIFAEKATLMPNQYEPARASAALYALMVRQLYDNPSLSGSILSLYGGDYERTGREGEVVDGVPVVDVFLVESIRNKNCFSAPLSTVEDTKPTTPSNRLAKGLWPHAGRMNHSCVPNTALSFLGDLLVSRATRAVRAGDELSHQYVPVKALADVRQAQFRVGWGFACGCPLCAGEMAGSADLLDRRKEVLGRIEGACGKRPPPDRGPVPDSAIRTVDRLARSLEALHERDVYDALPRLAMVYPTNWLIEAHRSRRAHGKVVRYALRLLREFGFRVPAEEGAEWEPVRMYTDSGEACMVTIHVVTALKAAADAYRALGRAEMAAKCEEAGRLGYKMIVGYESDWSVLSS